MSDIRITITKAGRAALVNAQHTGTAARHIVSIGVTAQAFTPDAGMSTLPGEIKRLDTIGGAAVAADTLHVTLQDMSQDSYTLRGFALYLDDGTLFALHGGAETIMEKSAQATLMLAADINLADLGTTALHIGPANFTNPPASTTVAGVVRFATTAETAAGYADDRAVSPATLKAETSKLALAGHTHSMAEVNGLQQTLGNVLKFHDGGDAYGFLTPNDANAHANVAGVLAAGGQNTPDSDWTQLFSSTNNTGGYGYQLAVPWHSGHLYIRHTINGTYREWRKVWDSSNFDPGSKAAANHGHGIGHINGLADALAGKAAASHGHSWSQITDIPASAMRWPNWNEVNDKPSLFPPQPHVHTAADITSGLLDTARIPTLPMGKINSLEYELSNRITFRDSLNGYLPNDANTLGITAGAMVHGAQNTPKSDWTQMFSNIADRFGWQLAAPWHEANLYVRSKIANTLHPWRKLWDSGNFDPTSKLNASQFHWQHLPGKPQTFPAASHRHGQSDIDGLPDALANKVAKITDAPSLANRIDSGFYQTNNPSAGWPVGAQDWWHALSVTHGNLGNYYALQFAASFGAGGADLHVRSTNNNGNAPWFRVWNSGNFDPASKANANHGHGIGQINGLTDALAGKAAASHTHAMSDITGLAAALDPGHQHAETGWAKLPGGLILQWGRYVPGQAGGGGGGGSGGDPGQPLLQLQPTSNQAGGYPKIHFPIQFPQGCFVVTTTDLNPASSHQSDAYSQLYSYDKTGFVIFVQNPHGGSTLFQGCTWIAIGC